jgi:hypothetical protein
MKLSTSSRNESGLIVDPGYWKFKSQSRCNVRFLSYHFNLPVFRTCFGIRSLDIYPTVSNLGYITSAGIVINKFSVVKVTSITEGHTWYWLCFVNRWLGLYRPLICSVAVWKKEQWWGGACADLVLIVKPDPALIFPTATLDIIQNYKWTRYWARWHSINCTETGLVTSHTNEVWRNHVIARQLYV